MANTLRENVLLAAPPKRDTKRDKRAVCFSNLDSTIFSIKCR